MKVFFILGISLLFSPLLYCQETITFDEISSGNYNNGFLYIESKSYSDSAILIEKNINQVKEFPIITKEIVNSNLFYSFTGYVIESMDYILIITVRVKFLNDNFDDSNYELFDGLQIIDGDFDDLTRNKVIYENGLDSYGQYTVLKELAYKEAYTIEELCKMMYAAIIKYNFDNIDKNKISRQLYYLLDSN